MKQIKFLKSLLILIVPSKSFQILWLLRDCASNGVLLSTTCRFLSHEKILQYCLSMHQLVPSSYFSFFAALGGKLREIAVQPYTYIIKNGARRHVIIIICTRNDLYTRWRATKSRRVEVKPFRRYHPTLGDSLYYFSGFGLFILKFHVRIASAYIVDSPRFQSWPKGTFLFIPYTT